MAKGDDIESRLIDFAVRIINLCDGLPKTRASNHVSGQLLRSGTAPAALYAEARGAESTKDFIHKLKLCLKELNESRVWLKIITKSEMLPETKLRNINQECDELCRIINASVKTMQKKL
jgi:four helix bundle protein